MESLENSISVNTWIEIVSHQSESLQTPSLEAKIFQVLLRVKGNEVCSKEGPHSLIMTLYLFVF